MSAKPIWFCLTCKWRCGECGFREQAKAHHSDFGCGADTLVDLIEVYEAAHVVVGLVPRVRRNDYDQAWKALELAMPVQSMGFRTGGRE